VVTVQAKIRAADGSESVLPVVIPDLNDVRELAVDLHQRGLVWEGDAFGWHAEHVPQRAEPPVQSSLAACRYRAGRGGDGWPATVDTKVNGRTLSWIAATM
jgi:hypothetical protein